MIALAVTQSHVFLEKGADPMAVFELAKRRLRAFLSFLDIGQHADHICRVGASAPFLVGKWRVAAPFIHDEDLAGVDYSCAEALDGRNTLNILKMAPGLLAGALSFFDRSVDTDLQQNVFDFFKSRDRLVSVASCTTLHAFELKALHRTSAYSIGKKLGRSEILDYPGAPKAIRDYHATINHHSPWVHPLIRFRLGWSGWADEETFLSFYRIATSEKMDGDGLATQGLRIFAESFPERYDDAYIALKQGGATKRALGRAATHMTPAMSSFSSLSGHHWARCLEVDLGL
jgi:hypothetical protein